MPIGIGYARIRFKVPASFSQFSLRLFQPSLDIYLRGLLFDVLTCYFSEFHGSFANSVGGGELARPNALMRVFKAIYKTVRQDHLASDMISLFQRSTSWSRLSTYADLGVKLQTDPWVSEAQRSWEFELMVGD